ncbi:hypothetical protein ABVK25_001399 [Lepraria finkii]|uniref:Uncharacterized protein n=1 Tax=Lepraria finkii TaxID=1340010 RepID=A0ABR4BPJ6_9LECA
MNAVPLVGHRNDPGLVNASSGAALDSQCMVPGKTYVGILPGHSKLAFIRKRRADAGKPPWLLTQIFGSARHACSVVDPSRFTMFSRRHKDRYYYDYATDTYRPLVVAPLPSVRQTCASCGRFRSANWQARHPLVAGASSSSNISGGVTTTTRVITRTTILTVTETRQKTAALAKNITTRSRSREDVRIVIANQSGDRVRFDRVIPRRELTTSSSTDGVRVIRRTEVIDAPRRLRCRSRLRSSGVSYIEDGARDVEDLTRPRCRSRPRRSSRTNVDDLDAPRRRARPRSSSRVTFGDDVDDPIVVTRPRSRLSRRRAMVFDGAADSEMSEDEVRGRTRSYGRGSQKAIEDQGAAELIEEVIIPRAHSFAQKDKRPSSGAELIAETVITHSRAPSRSVTAEVNNPFTKWQEELSTADTPNWHDSYHHPAVETVLTDYDSDYNVTPRPVSPSARRSVAFDDDRRSTSRRRSYSGTTNIDSHRRPLTLLLKSGKLRQDQDFEEPGTPRRDRRRRFRDTNIASDSEDEDSLQRSPRYYRTPSPPSPLQSPDVLGDTFESTHITPPGGASGYEYARGRPTQRTYRSEGSPSMFESAFYWPDLYQDAETASDSYVFGAADEEEYEPPTGYDARWEPWMEYDTQAARDYDWMT